MYSVRVVYIFVPLFVFNIVIVFYRAATGTNVTYLSTIMSVLLLESTYAKLNRRKDLNKEIIEKFALF